MSDVFREVDEDLRREQLKRLWQRYRWFVIGGAVLIIVAVAGYQLLQSIQQSRAAESGDRFEEATRLFEAGDLEGALAEYQALAEDGYAHYPDLAAMAAANTRAEIGEIEQAVAELDRIAGDSGADPALRAAATIRAAFLMAGTESLVETRRRVEPFNEEGGAYRVMALELMAVAAINEGEYDLAMGWLTEMTLDPLATNESNNRALLLSSYIASRRAPTNVLVDTPAEGGIPQLVAPNPAFGDEGVNLLEAPAPQAEVAPASVDPDAGSEGPDAPFNFVDPVAE